MRPEAGQDPWAEWIRHGRHGGDAEYLRAIREAIDPIRDRMLRNASIHEGDVVLDVGCGDGLLALAALERVGERGRVLFSDISAALLDDCHAVVGRRGDAGRCRFLQLSAEALTGIDQASVDVVTVGSVLCHVPAKARAFEEFLRVLKGGGRLSMYEPIARFGHPAPLHLFWGYDVTSVLEIAMRVRAVYGRVLPVEKDAFGDFDERELVVLAEKAGFGEVHLHYEAEVKPAPPRRWDGFVNAAPNPRVPTLAEAMRVSLRPSEARLFVERLRPLVEQGRGIQRTAAAYLWAVKS